MRLNAGTVLLFNCSGPEFSRLRQIFAMLRLRMHPVTPERYHLTLGQLASGTGEAGEAREPIQEKVLVFCNLGDALFHQVLEVIRHSDLPPIDFKAVLTESNASWTIDRLLESLYEEKAAIARQIEAQRAAAAAEDRGPEEPSPEA